MSAVVADTHALIWYVTEPNRLSAAARAALNAALASGEPIRLASVSHVEMRYLVEKGKISSTTLDRVDAVLDAPASSVLLVPLDLAIARAVQQIARADVPDMPDRIIAATAWALKLPSIWIVTGPDPALTRRWSGTSWLVPAGVSGYWLLDGSLTPMFVGMSNAVRMLASDGSL